MRDKDRIDKILLLLFKYWNNHPDLRLGQIIMTLSHNKDPFYIEDETILVELEKALKQ